MSAPAVTVPSPLASRRAVAATSRRDDLVTVLLGAWLVTGVFVDGWAHMNLTELETFLTPWHGLLYSGYAASAAWFGWLAVRGGGRGAHGIAALAAGYRLGALGVVVFGLSGAADLAWHSAFGIEVDSEALYSPPHLGLFVGALLLLTSPLRAAAGRPGTTPQMSAFLPALASLALATAAVAFFLLEHSAFLTLAPTAAAGQVGDPDVVELLTVHGIASVLLTTVVLVGPVLYVLRRWRLPTGSVTVLWTVPVALLNVLVAFQLWPGIVAALVAGIAADLLGAWLRPGPGRPTAVHVTGFVLPLLLWSAWFASLAATRGLAWTPALWGGATVLAALGGLGLATLTLPPDPASTDGTR